MCGILFATGAFDEVIFEQLQQIVSTRGPDSCVLHADSDTERYFASVLHLRGDTVVQQPYVMDNGDILCWNGEIFDGVEIGREENDTKVLARRLSQVSGSFEEIVKILAAIEGPFAFVYRVKATDMIYFGRDIIGRRSLLMNSTSDSLMVSSVSYGTECGDVWQELEAGCIYSVSLKRLSVVNRVKLENVAYRSLYNNYIPKDYELLVYDDGENFLPLVTPEIEAKLLEFHETLLDSVRRRVCDITQAYSLTLGILFSGGLDCTILAVLCAMFLLPNSQIDLFNVAFENPRIQKVKNNSTVTYDVPDRIVGRSSFLELQNLMPGIRWNFVEINVDFEQYQTHKQHIIRLMHPNSSVMDLSIAAALWFASRGQGSTANEHEYFSEARVLISGLGADELTGGYSRHQRAFQCTPEGSYQALNEALLVDLERIPTRNLGRDDRIISSNGKEVRFPFLARPVVEALVKLPVHWKCDFRKHVGRGIGEKVWLRLYAKHILKLGKVCIEKKRAIQFGARTAKMESSVEKGSDHLT